MTGNPLEQFIERQNQSGYRIDDGDVYVVYYTCTTPGCNNSKGDPNFEVTNITGGQICGGKVPITLTCGVCKCPMVITEGPVAADG